MNFSNKIINFGILNKFCENCKEPQMQLAQAVNAGNSTHYEKPDTCLETVGKAQVLMQNNAKGKPTSDKEIDELLNKIFINRGMKVGRHVGDRHISIGRPIEGFSNLYYDDLRAVCKRDKENNLSEIYIIDKTQNQFPGSVYVYSCDGKLKKHFTIDEMKALKEYKYTPEPFHNFLRNGENYGLQSKEELESWIETIDTLFTNPQKVWKTDEKKVIYRALPMHLSDEQKRALSHVGSIYEENSYSSTTEEYAIAKRFKCHNPILEIEMPENSSYLDLDALFNIDRKRWMEQELLLPRNSQFLVKGYDKDKDIIKVQLIN